MVKKLLTKKNVIILSIILILFILIIILSGNKITKLEKDLLKEQSSTYMYYMSNINHSDIKIDSYIAYLLEYSSNEESKSTLNTKEISEKTEKLFNKKYSEDDINSIGITPLLLDKGVSHNPETKEYSLSGVELTQREIADKGLVYYKEKSIKKRGKKYIVKYDKYFIKDPYSIFNYYNDLSLENSEKNNKSNYDTSKIYDYLTCKGKIKDILSAVNDDILEKNGEKQETIKVIYKLNGTKFVIYDIK